MIIALKENIIVDNEDDSCLSYVITYDITRHKTTKRERKREILRKNPTKIKKKLKPIFVKSHFVLECLQIRLRLHERL